jgi:hypothetical protein
MHHLRFESRERMYGLLKGSHPFSTSLGPWRISEIYRPDVHNDVSPGLGAYSVVLETHVGTIEDLLRLHSEGVAFCEELEPAWLYVWGTPLHRFGWGVRIEELAPPKGWSTNYEETYRTLQLKRSGLYGKPRMQSRKWLYASEFPLERALRVKDKIAGSDEILKAMVRFHYQAHTTGGIQAAVFFLCKGLEIVREILPGKGSRKEMNLPEYVRDRLTQPLHQLFGTANTQLETRHALRSKGGALSLHPPLGSAILQFVTDVDLVLRTVVCIKLGEDPVLVGKDGKEKPLP